MAREMTKEKAIQIFNTVLSFGRCDCQKEEIEESLKMAIKAIDQTRWIPCSEGLPEDGTWNLFTDGKTISVERYKFDAIDHFFPNGRWFSLEEAVAWMPLPERYRESEGEE